MYSIYDLRALTNKQLDEHIGYLVKFTIDMTPLDRALRERERRKAP